MDILGIGPLELIFILILALIIFGPNDLVKAGKSAGRFMRKIVTSPEWRAFQQASREMRNLPNKLMREAGIDELKNEIGEINVPLEKPKPSLAAWTTPLLGETPASQDEPPAAAATQSPTQDTSN